MIVRFGNKQLSEIVKPEYIDQIQAFMEKNGFKHTQLVDDVRKSEGNYHIYDMPRVLEICGETKAHQFVNFIKDNDLTSKAFEGQLAVTFISKAEEEQS